MEITLKIGDPLTPARRRNKYQLDLKFMHGDADAYTDSKIFFDVADEQRLKHFLAIEHYISENYNDTDKLEAYALEYLESIGMSLDEREQLASDFRDNFYEGDCTCDGCSGAAITEVTVTWWDASGIQHEVDVLKGN